MSETIVRRVRKDNYAIIPNHVAEDDNLSLDARGLLVYLLAKPSDWRVRMADIQKRCKIGREKAYKLINALKDAGYLEREIVRENGKILRHEIIIYDEPIQKPQDVVETSSDLLAENQEVGKLLYDLPDVEFQDVENQHTYQVNTDTNNPSLPSTPNPKSLSPTGDKDFDILFEGFWTCIPEKYRNQIERKKAFCKFQRVMASESVTVEELTDAFTSYRQAITRQGRKATVNGFFRKNTYRDFIDAPPIGDKGQFVISPGMPEWGPWLGDIREKFGGAAVDRTVAIKRIIRNQRWPDGYPKEERNAA